MRDGEFNFDVNVPIRRISDDAILCSLREFVAQQESNQLTTLAYDAWPAKVCTAGTVIKRFGSWRAAMQRVGVKAGVQPFAYSIEELLDNLERVWIELGYAPGRKTLPTHGAGISAGPYLARWGSVKNVCRLLSQYKNGEITQEQLLGSRSASARGTISLKVRWDVMKRGHYMCAKCGSRPPDVFLEVDHIVPLARGGTDAITNLQVPCNRCNQSKKARLE